MSAPYAALTRGRDRKQPYHCVVMDVYPDVLVANGSLREDQLATRFLRWLSRVTWRRAAGVFVLGRCMEELVVSGGVDPARVHLFDAASGQRV